METLLERISVVTPRAYMRGFLRHLRQPAQTRRRFTYNKQHKFLAVDAENFEGYLSQMTCRMYFVVRKFSSSTAVKSDFCF